jgi:hypothetical protein
MIKIPAYFLGFNSKTDGSAGLRFASQEITDIEFANLKRNLNAFGWLLFAENEAEIELPKEPASEDKDKTPSKRQRNVLYKIWEKEKPFSDFETFYRKEMEIKIEKDKERLE